MDLDGNVIGTVDVPYNAVHDSDTTEQAYMLPTEVMDLSESLVSRGGFTRVPSLEWKLLI